MSPLEIVRATGATIVEEFELPVRPERLAAIPASYAEERITNWLHAMTGSSQIYTHQRICLEQVDNGANVVLNTSTASGKTLAFLAPIMRGLMQNPREKALLLYPQKALGGDQRKRIEAALAAADMVGDLVGVINGDVPMEERFGIIERASLVLATPDVVQSWVMRLSATPQVQAFLRALRWLVIDEAHVLEGVFGSNTAFLLRRLLLAIDRACSADGANCPPLQVIAASATMRDAAAHMQQLTGRGFVEVGEADNGAPFHGLTMLHVDGPAYGPAAEAYFAELCARVADDISPHAFIAFADTRQGVEHICQMVQRDDVLPYRGGYEPRDRQCIEQALWNGNLRGAISTSALELGVDIPQLPVGLNLGVPQTRKAFRQRVGRIGRSMPGVFALVAPANEFSRLGGSMREFFEGEVEPSRLYLDNPYIQLQAARCLVEECA